MKVEIVMAEIFTALGTWVLVVITFCLVRGQITEAKSATGLQLFTQLAHDFQDASMRMQRMNFAVGLLYARQSKQPANGPLVTNLLADETVLEFLENLAHPTRGEMIEKKNCLELLLCSC
jgi:hypothetical protein